MAFSGIATSSLTRFSALYKSPLNFKVSRTGGGGLIGIARVVSNSIPCLKLCCIRMASSASPQDKLNAPFGSWKSPITADIVSGAEKRLGGTATDAHGRLILLESRPTESGYYYYSFIHSFPSTY